MLANRLTGWLRPASTLLALAGALALTACGGGGGSINNPNQLITPPAPPALVVSPDNITVYSGVPATLTITSGVAPFQAFSNNPTLLSPTISGATVVLVAAQVDPASGPVNATVTITDAVGQTDQTSVTIQAAPLLNTLTVLPAGPDCGNNLCSGQNASVTGRALGPGGAPLPNRQVRFDVVYGPFGITTSNPLAPVAQTLTVATDATGLAQVQIRANTDAVTQFAQVRAIDLGTGQQAVANFVIQNNTVAGQSPLTVVPSNARITGAFTDECSSGFRTDYFIYGGNPPYRISSTFPAAVTLQNSVVSQSGGFFSAVTNGTCVNPVIFTIVDAAGKQATAQLINEPGTQPRPAPTPVPNLVITPTQVTNAACSGKTFPFVITGGTPPYGVATNPAGALVDPQTVPASGGTVLISLIATGSGVTQVIVVDSTNPQKTVTATITCS